MEIIRKHLHLREKEREAKTFNKQTNKKLSYCADNLTRLWDQMKARHWKQLLWKALHKYKVKLCTNLTCDALVIICQVWIPLGQDPFPVYLQP